GNPTWRPCCCAGTATPPKRSTSSSPSTSATSWPAGCGRCGKASPAAGRPGPASRSSWPGAAGALRKALPAWAHQRARRTPTMAELVFDCIGAQVDRYAAVPSFGLDLRISETSGEKVDPIALRAQTRIGPSRRPSPDAEAERVNGLFGEGVRWADTLKPLQFTTISTMVPGFTGSIQIELPVPFTYDLQIASRS